MKRLFAALAVVCGTLGCKVDLNGTCAKDSDCKAGLSCDSSVDPRVCVSACDPICGSTETCANAKCVSTGPVIAAVRVTDSPAPGLNGFYARSGANSIPVSVDVIPGFGGQIASVFLTVNGNRIDLTTSTTEGTVTTYSFIVPTLDAPSGTDGPLLFQVTATDASNNQTQVTPTSGLKIDDAGPVVRGVAVDATLSVAEATVGNVPWFRQSAAGDIDVKATIVDPGTGVDITTVALMQGSTRIDKVGSVTRDAGTDNYHFKVARIGVPVAAGVQALIGFTVAASDVLGKPRQTDAGSNLGSGSLGIDGQPPTVSFAPTYPSGGCATGGTIVCGHDGNHFWRLGDDGALMTFSADDGASGSGANALQGMACAIPGNTCTPSAGTSGSGTALNYSFAFTPSIATLTSGSTLTPNNTDDNGDGVASVTVTARDNVGNSATAGPINVNVTRVKWVRTLTGLANIRGSPVVTPPVAGKTLVLIAGTNAAADPIVALDTTGAVFATTGHVAGVTSVTANMAYSPLTNKLYVVQQNASNAYAFSLSVGGFTTEFVCTLGGQTNGAPAVIGSSGASERMLVADTGSNLLWAIGGTGGSCPANQLKSVSVGAATPGTVGAPISDGATVYFAYGDTGIAKVPFSLPNGFGTLVKNDLTQVVVGSLSLLDSLFYGENKNYHAVDPVGLTTQAWTTAGAGGMSSAITAPPVISDSLVFGVATVTDGHVRAFDQGTGADTVDFPATASVGAPSAVAVGVDNVIYFSDSGQNEMVAVKYTKSPGASAARVWRFKGTSVGSGASNVTFTGPGSEPTMDSSGVIYFGADNGNVYALMTDSGGAAVPTAGTNWPRVGFDNCNSGNNSYTNCH
ncbi:MAG: hypothetical protein ACJ79H_10750 [Myxococcales bacterium]